VLAARRDPRRKAMTAEKWEQVKALFETALGESEANRESLLRRQCEDDLVRHEVLRLLSQNDRMNRTFLDAPGQVTLVDQAAGILAKQNAPDYIGELLADRYFVEREIGRGGIGVVYRAQDRQLHSRNVVLKFLHAGWQEHAQVQHRFRQEIEALSRIHHPGVVGVLDAGRAPDGRLFLVMEYVEGATLRSRLQEGGMEIRHCGEIVESICDALDAAHQNGIFHRDLKPENIMVARNGAGKLTAKLIDFGIAKVQGSGFDATTQTTTIIGTVRYSAPEQLMGQCSAKSDIYALGVVCYEMLTGCLPFNPETPFQMYELQRSLKLKPPSRLRKEIPPGLDRAILRALSFRPEDRQNSAREYADEFRAPGRNRWGAARRLGTWAAAVALSLAATASGWNLVERRWEPSERAIEFAGGHDPEDAGFPKHLDLVERAVYNNEHTGFDAVRLLSPEQGFYYHRLSRPQVYAAMRHGWSLEATIQPVLGQANANIDLGSAGGRFDLHVRLDSSGDQIVRLTTRIEKGFDGPECKIDGPANAFHDYRLIFDPVARQARLLVDGVERLRGYSGHREFIYDYGLTFGTALNRSDRAESVFKRVKFEIGGR
jgi:eukaryotic-like serine/threonine-protein kinase